MLKLLFDFRKFVCALGFFGVAALAPAAVYTVNHAGDEPDGGADGLCDTGSSPGNLTGRCTLRAAMQNAVQGDSIYFAPEITRIEPLSPLPLLYGSIIGTGSTPQVEISGVNLTSGSGIVVAQSGGLSIRHVAINGFPGSGIVIQGLVLGFIDDVEVVGCYIGLTRQGSDWLSLGNLSSGIQISQVASGGGMAHSVLIDECVISGNYGAGIYIGTTLAMPPSSKIRIQNNIIGLDPTGTALRPNSLGGISMGNTLMPGPTDCDIEGNVISGNYGDGIVGARSYGNRIRDNYIGTDISGTYAKGNQLSGITLNGSDNETIENNLISGNFLDGVSIGGIVGSATAAGNILSSNLIGTDLTGTAPLLPDPDQMLVLEGQPLSGNGRYGIGLFSWSVDSVIGKGPTAAIDCMPCNTIAFNGGPGVAVVGPSSNGQHSIRGNAIYGNGSYDAADPALSMGIDLGDDGPTPNDINDPDAGTNQLQNKPVIDSIVYDGMNSTITGRFDSDVNTPHMLDFYECIPSNATGYGDAKTYLGSLSITFAQQSSPFMISFPGNHKSVSITATDKFGNTSEFSTCGTAFTVNSNRNLVDNNPGDGLCDTGNFITDGRRECTLWAAIQESNALAGPQTVLFDLLASNWGPNYYKISPPTPLPPITQALAIDATSQPGYSFGNLMVELDGTSCVDILPRGLDMTALGCSVRGMSIYAFDFSGVDISGPGGCVVQSCLLGLNAQGAAATGNGQGLRINSSPDNLIGGTSAGLRNVISGNDPYNLSITGAGATSNRVQGNYIGTTKNGQAALNVLTEVGVRISGASFNRVGGLNVPGAGNVISGQEFGVYVLGPDAMHNVIQGNLIGPAADGTTDVGNSDTGVLLEQATYCNIGGSLLNLRNVISGNGIGIDVLNATEGNHWILGNIIGLDKNAQQLMSNLSSGIILESDKNRIGLDTPSPGSQSGNIISGNLESGITIYGSANEIKGNIIGSNEQDNPDLFNGLAGIRVEGSGNFIGDGNPASRNVISGNIESGILLIGATADNNAVFGNYIGTTKDGMGSLPNLLNGVAIVDGAEGNYIGGSFPEYGNVISGNIDYGVAIYTSAGAPDMAGGNYVYNNTIGSDITRLNMLPNKGGIAVVESPANVIGSLPFFPGSYSNYIMGNLEMGIGITGSASSNNLVQGNAIGIDTNPSSGSGIAGITLNDCEGTTVDGNMIAHHFEQGVVILGPSGSLMGGNHRVFNNLITDNGLGASVPGLGFGVIIEDSFGNTIGPGNTIKNNYDGGIGVNQTVPPSRNNAITANSISGNINGLGIDLDTDGPTANDALDPDGGPNNLINYPTLTAAYSAPLFYVQGIYEGAANQQFYLEFFSVPFADSSGYGEGQTYLGWMIVQTDALGNAPFVFGYGSVAAGTYITATAWHPDAGTSEFSEAIWVADASGTEVDYGDAADPNYPTLADSDGARHVIASENPLHLGLLIDAELDGFPSLSADGDDLDTTDDEDGVYLVDPLQVSVTSNVQIIASDASKIDAWFDWNHDGDWNDPGEKMLNSSNVALGNNLLPILVPAGALSGSTPARFRLSTTGGLAPTGPALDGEVEDYVFNVTGSGATPTPFPSATPSPTPSPTPFNNALANGSSMPPKMKTGTQLIVTFTFRNTGNTTWTLADGYALQALVDDCAMLPSSEISLIPTDSVSPFTNFEFLSTLNAPYSPGSCNLQLQMTQNGVPFGAVLNRTVIIEEPVNATKDWTVFE